MADSILQSTKRALSISETVTVFDSVIIMHINSVFSTLTQLGVGLTSGYSIEDDTPTWEDLLEGDLRYNMIKSYMYLKVRMLFDPPTTSFAIAAFKDQASELEWRISTNREADKWVPPVTTIDGGNSVGDVWGD
jgi:hypothetical protein